MIAALAVAAAVTGQAASPRPPRRAPPAAAASATPGGPVIVYRMQQIVVAQLPADVIKQMEPLHSLDAVEALLKANKIPFGWRDAEISATQIAPDVQSQLAALPPHEVFVAPQGQGWVISVIVEQHPAPAASTP